MDGYENNQEGHVVEEDLPGKANRVVWFYFILLGITLYLLIAGLSVLFRIELLDEEQYKVGDIQPREKMELRFEESKILSGEKGLLADKKPVSIDEAMLQVLRLLNKPNS